MTPTDFDLHLSITDLFLFPNDGPDGEQNDEEIKNEFSKILKYLGFEIHISSLFKFYIDNVRNGEGDIYIFKNDIGIFILDLYKDDFDQIDMISIFLRQFDKKDDTLLKLASDLFYSSEYRISFGASIQSNRICLIMDEPVKCIDTKYLIEFYKDRKKIWSHGTDSDKELFVSIDDLK